MSVPYRESHQAEGKGLYYDGEFEKSRFLAYLWGQECALLRSVMQKESDRVGGRLSYLDFACGTGRIISALEAGAERVVGVDISASMLSMARPKVSKAELVLGDALTDPSLISGDFDFATAFRFFPNADPSLREETAAFLGARVRPGGLLVVNNHQNSGSALCLAGRVIGKRWGWTPMANKEMTTLLRDAGFRAEGARGFGMLPGTDRRPYAPIWLHRTVDRLASSLGIDRFAQDVVMWFRRA